MKRMLIVSVALLALAGCGKKEAAKAPGAATSGAAAPAPAAVTPPPRKAGLWQQTISADKTTQVSKICLDAAVDQKMNWWGTQAAKSACEENKITPRPGGGWDFHAVCETGPGGRTISDGQATGDFGSHYTVAVTSTTTGSAMPLANGVHKTKIDAAWQSPCPANMKPGDMTLPGGMKINVLSVMGKAGK